MSRTKQLPIYRVSYQLLTLITELVRHFARDFRPSLGDKLHTEAVTLVMHIYRANAAEDKRQHIKGLLESLEVVEMLLQLSADLKLISLSQYAQSVEITSGIGRQAGGWLKFAMTSRESVDRPAALPVA